MKRSNFLIFGLCFYFVSSAITIHNNTPGNLNTLFTVSEKDTITALKLIGNIDVRDLYFIRDEMRNIFVLDISEVSIKEFKGQINGQSFFQEGVLPKYIFFTDILGKEKNKLENIKLPNTIIALDDFSIGYAGNLKSITIPSSMVEIAPLAFVGGSGLNAIYVYSKTPENYFRYSSQESIYFKYIDKTKCVLFVPNGSVDEYKTAYMWSDFQNIKGFEPVDNRIIK